jgi:hypothetical protein
LRVRAARTATRSRRLMPRVATPPTGGGSRSAAGLGEWCRFVLGVFREKIEFVFELLEPVGLRERLRDAVTQSLDSTEAASNAATRLVRVAWDDGPITRSRLARVAGALPLREAPSLFTNLFLHDATPGG